MILNNYRQVKFVIRVYKCTYMFCTKYFFFVRFEVFVVMIEVHFLGKGRFHCTTMTWDCNIHQFFQCISVYITSCMVFWVVTLCCERHQGPPKHWHTTTSLHGATMQKTTTCMLRSTIIVTVQMFEVLFESFF